MSLIGCIDLKALPIVLFFLWQSDIPFKNSDEFVVTVEIKYKPKADENAPNTYSATGERKDKMTSEMAPFLIIYITELKILSDEVKMRAVNTKEYTLFKRKTSPDKIHIDMGFLDDVKAGTAPNEVVIYFMNAEKKDVRKIACTILSDGTFQVNGKWHGKF